MNRAERRAANRNINGKPLRKWQYAKPLPHEVHYVFSPIDEFIDLLEKGEVYEARGRALVKDGLNTYCEAAPAIRGFADLWERVCVKFGYEIDYGALNRLANMLEADMPIEPSFVEQVKGVIDRCRNVYRSMSNDNVKKIVRTQEIALENQKG